MFEVWKLETTQTLDGCKENYRQGEREERERKPRQDTITLNERSRDDEHEKRNGDGRYNYYDENLVEVEGKKEKMKQSNIQFSTIFTIIRFRQQPPSIHLFHSYSLFHPHNPVLLNHLIIGEREEIENKMQQRRKARPNGEWIGTLLYLVTEPFGDGYSKQYHLRVSKIGSAPILNPGISICLCHRFRRTWHTLLANKDVENSKELADVVRGVQKRYSKEKVREEFDSFEGWKGLMRKIVANEETVCDISFLRNWIFRPTLTSLLSKHQHLMSLRPPSLPLPSAHLASSLADHSLTSPNSNQPPFNPNNTDDQTTLQSSLVNSDLHRGSSSSLTLSQTDTDPSSSSLSLEAQPPPSHDTQSSFSPAGSDSGWMISTLHNLISAHLLRSSFQHPYVDLTPDDFLQNVSLSFDLNAVFSVSLFDEEDDAKIVDSLYRCVCVGIVNENLSHIDDPPAFVDRLIGTLGSSHVSLRIHSLYLLETIISEYGMEIVRESHLHKDVAGSIHNQTGSPTIE
ncbi:hypothetical protein BLNAU_5420 [Blattamonas nauphoetae]|uniref:Uncharacterized protein n=1 Tax=Blattamonas nauphoetae TaxID=2049346 RepID=A0ABQ9Y796_9EUKA|nr:hypothetical protein BLNAU_5420 [Blattamonas nauphoetae]